MRLKLRLFIVSLIVGMGLVKGQNLEYGVGVDTNYMMIGDQQHLTFRVRSDVPVQVVFPLLKDTVTAGVEIISGPVRDSLQGKDGKWLIEEKYVITAFDTGVYVIPAMPITVEDKSYNNVLRTDPIAFMVNTYKVDEQQGINDIVAPSMPVTFLEVLPTILLVLVGVVVLALIVWFVIRRRKEKPLFRREEPAIPPYVRAIQALDGLKAEKLWQEGKVKEYYTRLTDTVREYLNGELGIGAMEQTSFETLMAVENCARVNAEDRERLADLFQTADFVKFAKATPLPDENTRNLNIAYEFIQHTNQNVKELQQKEEIQQLEALEEEQQETMGTL
ncbi:MAG: hypothetical protein ACLTXP_18340 [Odoribacter splanchnicus]